MNFIFSIKKTNPTPAPGPTPTSTSTSTWRKVRAYPSLLPL